ncbi:MAG: GNAT family N-acetyltransferase [Candidatus Nanopelagicaceae bacterium]|nr:GNAT family N-acetyltransferase [Candidatus Nanopelagicaceae bacterium]
MSEISAALTPAVPPPSPGPVGARVSIRLQMPGEDGYHDLLGYLEAGNLVRRKDGTTTNFDPAHVVAWRQVPISPTTRSSAFDIESLEKIAQQNWMPEKIEEIGQWQLRSNKGFSFRANSTLPLGGKGFGAPGIELTQAISRVIDFYSDLKQPAIFQILPSIHQELERSIAALGFRSKGEVRFETIRIENAVIPDLKDLEVRISDHPTDEWLDLHADTAVGAELMLRTPSKYLHLYEQSELVATSRAAFTEDWAGISRVRVKQEKQGQGMGRKIMLATVNEIESNGVERAFLQVESENVNALAIYHSIGFSLHHYLNYSILEN